MERKHIMASMIFLSLIGLAAAQTVQSHPFSQLFPPDEDLGFGGMDLENASRVETAILQANTSDIDLRTSGDVTVLRYDDSQARWEVVNSDLFVGGQLNMNGNRITNVPAPSSTGDAVNKSYVDTHDDTIADDQNLQDVLSVGNSAGSYTIDMNSNAITNLADPSNAQDAATKSYVDNNDATGTDDQTLSTTGNDITIENGNTITFDDDDASTKCSGADYLAGDGTCNADTDTTIADDQTLSTTADTSGTDDDITISNGNTITIDDDWSKNAVDQGCSTNEFLNGNGNCETDTDTDTTLSETNVEQYVFDSDNDEGGMNIGGNLNMGGNEINSVHKLNGPYQTLRLDANTGWAELVNDGGSRTDLVLQSVYFDGGMGWVNSCSDVTGGGGLCDGSDATEDYHDLADVLNDNNAANQNIDMSGNNINNIGSSDFDMVYDSGQSRIELRSNSNVPICIGAC